jgi:hypothetical protein
VAHPISDLSRTWASNFPLSSLAKKVTFLQEHWGFPGIALSNRLTLPLFNGFMIEVGLYGNLLSWNYNNFGHLTTTVTWFSNLWHLCHIFFYATVQINDGGKISGVQVKYHSLMAEFFCISYQGPHLLSLNMVRKYKNYLHVSDVVLCNS